jgi:hypothetical protein
VTEGVVYKVVETSDVSAESLEQILNEWTQRGWRYEMMQFAMRDSSKRPAMAFVTFVRESEEPS